MICPATTPVEETEAYQELLARAERKTEAIPPSLLARHVLSVTSEADWPVQRAAMDAVLRRLSFAGRDELVIASRPPDRKVFGPYATRRKGSSLRPYRTVLRSVDPLVGSCDCPDFIRSSLGVCKHLLAVLEDLAGKPRRFRKALYESGSPCRPGELVWDPVRPLEGAGDPLARVRWVGTGKDESASSQRKKRIARRWFRKDGNGDLVLKERALSEPKRRLEAVRELLPVAAPRQRGREPGDPALVALLKVERSRLERTVTKRPDRRTTGALLRTLRRKLYPYQREGVDRFLATGRLLLADDMGLGKTVQAIASCHVTWHLGRVRRGLLIVPASLKSQWEREWHVFSDAPVEVVDGGPAQRWASYGSTKRGFLIVNYEQVLRDLEAIRRWAPDMVVLDEAQRIKNWGTKTASSVKRLQPAYRLVLTGTPMENRLDELASILEWVDDLALEPKWCLGPWHTTFADGRREVVGARNLDTLRARLAGCMVRRVRKDVLDQLPPRTDVRVPVEMTEEQIEEHNALKKPIASLLQQAKRRPLSQAEFLKLMQLLTTQRIISNGLAQLNFQSVWPDVAGTHPSEARLRGLSSPKLLELRQIVERLAVEQERKVVVFSQWRRMLQLADWAMSDILRDAGLRSIFFTGQEGQRRRTQNIVEFHDDPSTRVLLASDAGGVGLNLQRASNCCIHLELPWNPAVLEQRIGRIYRLGQKKPIDTYSMIAETGIESRIAGLVGSKQAFFKGLFEGESDTVDFEQSSSFLSKIETVAGESGGPASGEDGEDGEDPDDPGAEEHELDELLARADESRDREGDGDGSAGEAPARDAGERATAPHAPGDHSTNGSGGGDLFSRLSIERREDGGIRIDAPPDAASTLGELFEGMARLLREAASDPSSRR